jgi:hypothetical protein
MGRILLYALRELMDQVTLDQISVSLGTRTMGQDVKWNDGYRTSAHAKVAAAPLAAARKTRVKIKDESNLHKVVRISHVLPDLQRIHSTISM